MHPPHVRVAIIGSGFGGLGTAIRLKERGIHDFVVLERAGDVGGTWRDNSYPGCACDVESQLYSFSFAPNPDWTRRFSPQPEIWAYLKRCAERFGVLPHLRFHHEVREARWDDGARRWRIETAGSALTADALVMAQGALSEPAAPDIPGLATFTGRVFHSARWDHDYDLAGRRVAVIGTGASAIQFVPEIQPVVDRLHIFQRTPPWVVPRLDRALRGWERRLFRRVPAAQRLVRQGIYAGRELLLVAFRRPAVARALQRVALWHLARSVPDPALRAKLTPDYTLGCKRVLLSNDYLPALTRPNVELVTDGIAAVRASSVVDRRGVEREVDAIILATGFQPTTPPLAAHVRGRDGRTLAEHWAGSPAAHLGTTVAGFPNLFMLMGPNTGLGHTSVVYMIEAQIEHVLAALRLLDERGAATIEPRPEAQAAFVAEVDRGMRGTVWTSGGCASWYLDATGRNSTLWPDHTWRFRRRVERVDPAEYLLDGAPEPAGAPGTVPVLSLSAAPSGERRAASGERRAVSGERRAVLRSPEPRAQNREPTQMTATMPGVSVTLADRVQYRVARALARLPAAWQLRLAGEPPLVLDGQQLDPGLQLVRAIRRLRHTYGLVEPTVAAGRARFRHETAVFRGPVTEVGAVRDLTVDSAGRALRVRHYAPAEPGARPLLVYLHGGGFVIGDLETHDEPCRVLCQEAGTHVLSVDYRLAPEHPFPAALDDTLAALRWARREAPALGADPARISVGGDSAGGNLAAVAAQHAAAKGTALAAQLLVYPTTDWVDTYPSESLFGEGLFLTNRDARAFHDYYLNGSGASDGDARISPLHAPALGGLPPALVVTAGFDLLRDEGEAYGAALLAAGTPARVRRFAHLGHGFIHMTGVVPAAAAAWREVAREWKEMVESSARLSALGSRAQPQPQQQEH